MDQGTVISRSAHILDEVETARALVYRMLGHALAQPPDAGLLARLAGVDGDGSPIGMALRELAVQASGCSVEAARAEYDTLFIGVARGELMPYASFYLTGFLHERPLARLRTDLARLGFARASGRSDPEDHIATVCEVMASLTERGPAAGSEFFARHLAPWGASFFADLERANAARLYRPVGAIGRLMVELDRQGFAYADPPEQRGAA
jgi:TorA maturation chaperone TorD